MTLERKIKITEYTAIILLWALAITAPLLFMEEDSLRWRAVHVMWSEYIVIAVVFLGNRFLLMERLFFSRQYLHYAAALLLLISVVAVAVLQFDVVNVIISLFSDDNPLAHSLTDGFEPMMPQHSYQPQHSAPSRPMPPMGKPSSTAVIPPEFSVLILTGIVVALDMGLAIASKWLIAQQRETEAKRSAIATQLANLQSQVSPHFFMNTLNNIHALVDIDAPRAKQTIIELSELMSYLLYDCSNKQLVQLQREIDFINSYTNLMRLRYPKRVAISVSCSGEVPKVQIPPLIFLNFIENAFKYGVDYESDSSIKISFSFSESTIELSILNTNHQHTVKQQRHGLGIANARKRLELLYGDQFSLNIVETEANYYVNLKIPTI